MAGGRMGLQGLLNEAFTCPLKGLLKAATAIVTATAASRLLPLRLLTQAYYSHYHCAYLYPSPIPVVILIYVYVYLPRANDVYRVCLSVYVYVSLFQNHLRRCTLQVL